MSITNTVFARQGSIKGSVQKMKLVADMIKGKKASDALLQLKFTNKRAAKSFYDVLNSAVANAENNNGMDPDNLFIKEIHMGKSMVLKRFHARGRGRSAGIKKPYSFIKIIVGEK